MCLYINIYVCTYAVNIILGMPVLAYLILYSYYLHISFQIHNTAAISNYI